VAKAYPSNLWVMDYAIANKEDQKLLEEIGRVRQEIENGILCWADKNELKSELVLLYKRYADKRYTDLADSR
jgi:hypothetical protein